MIEELMTIPHSWPKLDLISPSAQICPDLSLNFMSAD